ncbi:unnamed protein product [Caretta caretta]
MLLSYWCFSVLYHDGTSEVTSLHTCTHNKPTSATAGWRVMRGWLSNVSSSCTENVDQSVGLFLNLVLKTRGELPPKEKPSTFKKAFQDSWLQEVVGGTLPFIWKA